MIKKKSRKFVAIMSALLVAISGVVSVSADEMTQKPDVSVIGNVDLDISITIRDATKIQMYIAKYNEFTDEEKAVSDVNKDNEINIIDVTNIQKYLARYNTDTAIGETVAWHEAVYKEVYHPAVTKEVKHDAVTEKKWVETKAAYTYEEPIYETRHGHWCNDCGIEITNWGYDAIEEHCGEHLRAGGKGSWSTKYKEVQVGTKTVEVPAEGYYKTVVVKEAWTETVVVKEAWTEKVLVKEAGWY